MLWFCNVIDLTNWSHASDMAHKKGWTIIFMHSGVRTCKDSNTVSAIKRNCCIRRVMVPACSSNSWIVIGKQYSKTSSLDLFFWFLTWPQKCQRRGQWLKLLTIKLLYMALLELILECLEMHTKASSCQTAFLQQMLMHCEKHTRFNSITDICTVKNILDSIA